MDYIAEALGTRYVESVPLNMERAWTESNPNCPLICLLSPGALFLFSIVTTRCKTETHVITG